MGKHKKIKVGDKFIVKPDVEVTVVEYHSSSAVVVEDSEGHRRTCKARQLHSGDLLWKLKDGRIRDFGDKGIKRKNSPMVGQRYKSQNHGWFVVLSIDNYKNMTIQFEDTGTVKSGVYTQVACNGKVSDPSRAGEFRKCAADIYVAGSRWKSNRWGWFEILSFEDQNNVTIKWDESGYIQEKVLIGAIRTGVLADQSRYNPDAWDYLKPAKGMHYVYFAKLGNEIIYIGQGKGRRYLHPNSGQSHNKELNKLYFNGENVVVEIYKDGLTEQAAKKLERELIKEISPRCNQRLVNEVDITQPNFET